MASVTIRAAPVPSAADATAIAAATVRNLARRTNHRTNRSLTAAFFRERHHTAKSHACY